ncbi:P-loop containing nucleoside triphosphate hydrolase protein [Podospora fimiseda]|uniref:P-loop containing nucleoside triphosphate hydrolase protein n=1 Tax=Podospora fimiseda TaxID=252190 RepID=A0AAN7C027_9PEZI|nr:P-loop containing nucleoside triphosphate hydrolase protein [Podospora fimiseda]
MARALREEEAELRGKEKEKEKTVKPKQKSPPPPPSAPPSISEKTTKPPRNSKTPESDLPSSPETNPPSSDTIPISYLPPPSNDPNQRAFPAVPLSPQALKYTTKIFTSSSPKFLYSAGRFLELPRNSHTPEVCLIGRSNVGKSTLINALSGLGGATARSSHGLKARQANTAITSRKAGCTVTLNGYGFGEAPVESKEQQQSQQQKKKEEKEKQSGLTRSERRQMQKEAAMREPPRKHALVMVDMPGYGHASKQAWGKEIQKYLEKRVMLKGAIVLIDSVSGVKDLDRTVLHNLRNAGLKTGVVLTKVDKLIEGKDKERAKKKIEDVCLSVWKELRGVERRGGEWTEGGEIGWEREVFITGAGDPRNQGLGVEGARWAICKMAGLVEDRREVVVPGLVSEEEVVGFDEIKWAAPVKEEEKVTTFEGMIEATREKPRERGERRPRASF